MDFTKQVTVDTNGQELITYDVSDIQAMLIKPDADVTIFTQRGTEGSGFKLAANQGLAAGHQDYDDREKAAHTRKTLSAIVAAGSTTVSVLYQGRGGQ